MSLTGTPIPQSSSVPVISGYSFENEVFAFANLEEQVLGKGKNIDYILDKSQIPQTIGSNLLAYFKSKLNLLYENGFDFLSNSRLAEYSDFTHAGVSIALLQDVILKCHSHDCYWEGTDINGGSTLDEKFRQNFLLTYHGPITEDRGLGSIISNSIPGFTINQTQVWLRKDPGIPSGSNGQTETDNLYDMGVERINTPFKQIVVGWQFITFYFHHRIYGIYDINTGNKIGDDVYYLPEVMDSNLRIIEADIENGQLVKDNRNRDNTMYVIVKNGDYTCYNWWGESITCPVSLSPQQGSNIEENDVTTNGSAVAGNILLDNEGRVNIRSHWEIS